MGEIMYLLGFQKRHLEHGIFFNQSKYTRDMLKKFNMEGCKPISTPMSTSRKIDANAIDEKIDPCLYRGMIGSLLCLACL